MTISRLLALLLVVLLACGDGSRTGIQRDTGDAAASEVVRLYTSVPEPIMDALRASFEAEHPGITLDVFRGTSGDVQARVATEQQAGGVWADVIWIAEPSAYEGFKRSGLLRPYDPPADAPIDSRYVDPDGYYVGGRLMTMVLAWNTSALSDGLSEWEDLLAPGLDAVFPAPTSGSALAAIKGISDHVTADFFPRFAEGGGRQVASNGAAIDGVVSGEFKATAVLDYMARQAAESGAPLGWTVPGSGAILIPSPLAITTTASDPASARAFADYLLSRSGQELVVQVGGFYPVRDDVAGPRGAPAIREMAVIAIDWEELDSETTEITEMWREVFGG